MSDIEQFKAIHAALFATATEESGEDETDENDFVSVDPDEYNALGQYEEPSDIEDEDDEYNEDDRYDEWIENTYDAGYGDEIYTMLAVMKTDFERIVHKLQEALDDMDNSEHRYYPEEYRQLESDVGALYDKMDFEEIKNMADEIMSSASDYSTY